MTTGTATELASLISSIPPLLRSISPISIASCRTVDNVQIVWFDGGIQNSTDSLDEITLNMLAPLERIEDPDVFVEFVTSNQKEEECEITFFLIINAANDNSHLIITTLHDFTQVIAIYVLQNDSSEDFPWPMEQYRKVHGPFSAVSLFYERLKANMSRSEHERERISFETWRALDDGEYLITSVKERDKQEASFMFGQLLKEVLLETSANDNDLDDSLQKMTVYCRQVYAGNKSNLNFIDIFENHYKMHTPVFWYTSDSFIYRMVNKALREQNAEVLFYIRTFIRDLHQQIVDFHQSHIKNSKSISDLPSTVYRGVLMPVKDFEEKIFKNIDGLLSINSFLSTSANKELALVFAGRAQKYGNDTAVLFAISMNCCSTSSVPFAFVDQIISGAEFEYLFSVGAVFRIVSIERIADIGIHCVHLTFTNDNDPQLACLTDYIHRQMKGAKLTSNIAYLLFEMGDYDRSAQFYQRLLYQSNLIPGERAVVLSNLGSTYDSAGDHAKALKYYVEALQIEQENMLPCEKTSCNVGYAYWRLEQYGLAHEYYQSALDLSLASSKRDNELIACIYGNMGTLLADEHNFEQSLIYHEDALKIRLEYLPSTHKDIAMAHYNTGNLLFRLGRYDASLIALKNCLRIQLSSLTPGHPNLRMTYTRIADTYRHLGRRDDALISISEAMQINLQTIDMNARLLGYDHPNIQRDVEELRLLLIDLESTSPLDG